MTNGDAHVTPQTNLGQLVRTLAYICPEQVLGDPFALDTRSDVYVLGVMLCRLLAGRLPYTLSPRLAQAVQTIRKTDPAPLSSISQNYRGDIETIAAKALGKDKPSATPPPPPSTTSSTSTTPASPSASLPRKKPTWSPSSNRCNKADYME
jgi:hypothetical protein